MIELNNANASIRMSFELELTKLRNGSHCSILTAPHGSWFWFYICLFIIISIVRDGIANFSLNTHKSVTSYFQAFRVVCRSDKLHKKSQNFRKLILWFHNNNRIDIRIKIKEEEEKIKSYAHQMQNNERFLVQKKKVFECFPIILCAIMRLNYMRSDENIDELLRIRVGWPWY